MPRHADLANGAMEIVDTLSRLAERSGVAIDGYSWQPDPASHSSEYYHLTVNAGQHHSEARFSRAVLADPRTDFDVELGLVLSDIVRSLRPAR